MIRTVVITTTGGDRSDVVMPGSYSIRNETRVLVNDYEFEFFHDSRKDQPKAHSIMFNKLRNTLVYSYEDDESKRSDEDIKTQRLIKIFFENHPFFLVGGKVHKNTKLAVFDIVDTTDKKSVEYKTWKEYLAVANTINNMDLSEKRAVAYYYGLSPENKTNGDLCIRLADFQAGVCMEPENIKSFLNVWSKNENPDRDLIITIRKAIAFEIIENRPSDTERDNYYIGNEYIGSEFNDIIAFCKREERIFKESVLRLVLQKDVFIDEEKGSKVEAKVIEGADKQDLTENQTEEYRIEAKQLKAKGYISVTVPVHIIKGQKLVDAVFEGRKNQDIEAKKKIAKEAKENERFETRDEPAKHSTESL